MLFLLLEAWEPLAVKRREFIALLGGAAGMPLAARAQQLDRVRRIGVLMGTDKVEGQSRVQALLKGLADLGWIEGRNVQIEVRYAASVWLDQGVFKRVSDLCAGRNCRQQYPGDESSPKRVRTHTRRVCQRR